MHEALLLVAASVAGAHDAWLLGLGRRRTLAGRIAHLIPIVGESFRM